MNMIVSTNPAKNYVKIGDVPVSSKEEIQEKVRLARAATSVWKQFGIKDRVEMLLPLLSIFKKRKKDIVRLTMQEIGEPLKEVESFYQWDEEYLSDFFTKGPKYLADQITQKTNTATHKIMYEPIGVAAAIVPWNFPFANFMWAVIPNLIAGNTVVFKHSEECVLMGKLIDEMMAELALPTGVFSQVYGDGKVGAQLLRQNIDLVSFTGSSAVGKEIYKQAGEKFIKTVLELGGSNPAIVFDDVDVDVYLDKLINGRFANNGQVCDAIKRLIVHESKFDEVVRKVSVKLLTMKVGDPEKESSSFGSLVAERQLELLEEQVADAVKKGAVVVCGGKRPAELKGAYYEPTLLTNVTTDMRVWTEEVFGPVLPVVSFSTDDEAIKLANDTEYGLGAAVMSKDLVRAKHIASRIKAGCIDINNGNHWISENPFGGYKSSGMGREHGEAGFRELTQIKVVSLE